MSTRIGSMEVGLGRNLTYLIVDLTSNLTAIVASAFGLGKPIDKARR